MTRSPDGNRRTPSVKRTRFTTCSASTSDFNSSQDQERSTPSFNHASSRCPDMLTESNQPLTPELNVRPLWLDADQAGRFIILEDTDTGDVLMPLSRLKELLGDNYSRSLNSADSRAVRKDKQCDFGIFDAANQLYWVWPFESPAHVKSVLRQALNDYSTGHIRLAPIPVVYNAMSKVLHEANAKKRDDSRITAKFIALQAALERVLLASSYAPLLNSPSTWGQASDHGFSAGTAMKFSKDQLFSGPHSTALTASKYMTIHRTMSRKKACQDVEAMGRPKRKGDATDLAQLREEMFAVQSHMSDQARRMEALEETLRETKMMFSRIFQIFTSEPQTEALYSQVRDCFNGQQEWDANCLQGRYSNDSTPRSQVSTQIFAPYTSETTPSQANFHPLKISAMTRQHSMACMPVMPTPVALQSTSYPQAACKSHHLVFPSPCAPNSQMQPDQTFGSQRKMAHTASASMLHNRNPTFSDCMPRSQSYRDMQSGGNADLTSFL